MADNAMGFSIKSLNDAARTDISIDIMSKHYPEWRKSQGAGGMNRRTAAF
jgi:hypothetical protein